MADINSPSTILPRVVASSTGGLTAQYESQGMTPKSGGQRHRSRINKSRRQHKPKRQRKNNTRKTQSTISFMTKWMRVGK